MSNWDEIDFTVQQGWQCPVCHRIYSPMTAMCFYCGSQETVTTKDTITFAKKFISDEIHSLAKEFRRDET